MTSSEPLLPEMPGPVADGELVADQPIGGLGIGDPQQRLGEAHQHDALARAQPVFAGGTPRPPADRRRRGGRSRRAPAPGRGSAPWSDRRPRRARAARPTQAVSSARWASRMRTRRGSWLSGGRSSRKPAAMRRHLDCRGGQLDAGAIRSRTTFYHKPRPLQRSRQRMPQASLRRRSGQPAATARPGTAFSAGRLWRRRPAAIRSRAIRSATSWVGRASCLDRSNTSASVVPIASTFASARSRS